MSRIPRLALVSTALLLVIACALAPATGTEAPTKTPAAEATLPPAAASPTSLPENWGSVSVVSSTLYEDNYGDHIVAGLVFNGTEQAVERVELTLQAADASGNSVLSRDLGSTFVDQLEVEPILEAIPSGGYAPFLYVINTGIPDTYSVEVTSTMPASDEFFPVIVENGQLLSAGGGDFYLVGELVNPNSFGVEILGLGGVILDGEGEVRAAEDVFYRPAYLMPSGDPSGLDRVPFGVHIYGPMQSFRDFAAYPLAVRGVPDEESAYTPVVTHTFVDSLGQYHVVGQVTSNTISQLGMPSVIGALYDSDGRVLSVYEQYSQPGLRPGETGSFDLNRFLSMDEVAGLEGRVAEARVFVNPGEIYGAFNVYTLDTTGISRQYDDFGPSWHFTGQVVNTSGETQGGATVSVDVYDADDRLVGSGFGYTSGGEAPVGGTWRFDFYVTLDPALDPATLRYEVRAWTE